MGARTTCLYEPFGLLLLPSLSLVKDGSLQERAQDGDHMKEECEHETTERKGGEGTYVRKHILGPAYTLPCMDSSSTGLIPHDLWGNTNDEATTKDTQGDKSRY
ncbi:hypothetical protein JB92DRAFT_2916994 [Gautieria morchelliformis]|nr:hypothetical protein JB92DRAFT_2916994 [Gautieria morchelliformis]